MQRIGHGKHTVRIEKRSVRYHNNGLCVVIDTNKIGSKATVRLTPSEAADLLEFLTQNQGIIRAAAQYENYMTGE
jgi:hypothetical protein